MPPEGSAAAYSLAGQAQGVRAAGIKYTDPSGRVLLLQRSATAGDYPGHWAFPAGSIEPGESPVVAAVRESFEEVGYSPEALPSYLSTDDGFVLFGVEVDPFEAALNDEHTAALWVLPSEAPRPIHPRVALQLGLDPAPVAVAEDSARMTDSNGWFEIQGNPLSKAGVFPYLGRSLRLAPEYPQPEPDVFYNVLRPPEELADPACIESFRLIPWVDEHTMLGSDANGMTPAERKGVQGVIGENVYFDGEYLRGNPKCFAEQLALLIQSGKRELSAGFRCVYEYAPGVYNGTAYTYIQRRIRGNHVALVDEGRCGPDVAVLDSADRLTFTFDAKEASPMADENTKGGPAKSIDLDSMTVSELVELAKALGPKVQAIQEATAALAGGAAPASPAVDGDTPPPAAKPDEEEAAAMDAKDRAELKSLREKVAQLEGRPGADDVLRSREARDRLYADLSKHVGAFDHADKSLDDVAKYGVEKLGIACDSGAELATLRGYLSAKQAPAPAVTFAQDSAVKPDSVVGKLLAEAGNQ